MSDIATSVRVNAGAAHLLSALSEKLGTSKAQVIELALKELEERTFWADVERAFAESPADVTEIAIWERASEVDFAGEKW